MWYNVNLFFCCSWLEVVEVENSLQLTSHARLSITAPHDEAIETFQQLPFNWTIDHDEDLAQFLCSHVETQNDNLGSIKNHVDAVDVSSSSVSKV